jgi:hypothetical protein
MRTLLASCALAAILAMPVQAEAPKMLKIDIVEKSGRLSHHHKNADCEKKNEPTEVHVRIPISLAKGFLSLADDQEVKINGKCKKGIKTGELIKLLESTKSGDMLVEVSTSDGDMIKICVE